MSLIKRPNGATLVVGALPVRDALDQGFYRGVGDELVRIVIGRRGALGLPDFTPAEQRAHEAYAALARDGQLPLAMRIRDAWQYAALARTGLVGEIPDDLWPFVGEAQERHYARRLSRYDWEHEPFPMRTGLDLPPAHIVVALIVARYHQSAYRRTPYGHNSFVVDRGVPCFRGSTERHDRSPVLHRSTLLMRVRDWKRWYTDIYLAGLSIVNGALVAGRITEGRTTWLIAGKQAPGYSVTTRLLRETASGSGDWRWIGKEESRAIIHASARHQNAA